MFTELNPFDVLVSLTALASLIVAVLKLHNMEKDLRLRTIILIKNVNRELIMFASQDPELLDILDGKSIKNKRKMKRFYQIWLNQIEFTYLSISKERAYRGFWHGFRTDAKCFLSPPHFQEIWQEVKEKSFYSPDFEAFIDELIEGTAKAL